MMIGFNMTKNHPSTIGICWGDGIGEHISNQAERVLRHVLSNDKNRIIYKSY